MRMTSLVAAMSAVVLSACAKDKDDKMDSSKMADSARMAAPTVAPAPAAPTMTDANIVALLDEVNIGDSTGGKMAATKGTKADVKAFGVMMAKDHHALRLAGLNLAKKLNLTPMAPANDSLPGMVKSAQDKLTAMDKGAGWDKSYIDGEIGVHHLVLDLIDASMGAAQAPELKDLLTKARPNIAMHLKRAEDIQSKLAADSTKKN